MGVSHGRSRVADLAFQVYARSVHPDWFCAREFRRITQARNAWEADARIIEGGHAVVFRAGPVRLTEVLAGPETPMPESGLLYHSPLRHERTASLKAGEGVEYQSCFEVEKVDTEVFAHLCDEMTLDASRGVLLHRFAPRSRMAPAPISHVRFEATSRGLAVQAFHTFPDERAIVRTQSLFEHR